MKRARYLSVSLWDETTKVYAHVFNVSKDFPKQVLAEKYPSCHCAEIEVVIIENIQELMSVDKDRLREAALSKLTKEERQALGL